MYLIPARPDAPTLYAARSARSASRETGEDALEYLKRPETGDVKTPHVWFKLGLLLFDGGSYAESLEAFRKCRDLSTAKGDL